MHKYIINQENVDRHCSSKDDSTHSVGNMWSTSQVSEATTTTEALISGPNRLKHLNVRKREACIDCNAKYWSDEGSKYPTVTATRKRIKGKLFYMPKARSPSAGFQDQIRRAFIAKQENVITEVFALINFLSSNPQKLPIQ